MSQSNLNHHVIVGLSCYAHDLSTPLDVSDVPGRIVQVFAERYTQQPGLNYELTIVYQQDSDIAPPKYRKLVRVSDHKAIIRAESVDHVGITQERPSAMPLAALVVMSGDVEPTYEVPDIQVSRNPLIPTPYSDGEFSIYYVKPEKGDVVCLSEYIFLANDYHKRDEGLGYRRVAASSLVGAISISREYFAKLGMLDGTPQAPATPLAQAPAPAKAPQRTYLQFEDLETGKVYQGFCLDEQTPRNLFEVGENPMSGKAVRAVGGSMWMRKEDMRPFVYLELNLVPYAEAIEEYNAQQGTE